MKVKLPVVLGETTNGVSYSLVALAGVAVSGNRLGGAAGQGRRGEGRRRRADDDDDIRGGHHRQQLLRRGFSTHQLIITIRPASTHAVRAYVQMQL